MNNSQLLQLVIATLPQPERITDIDFSSETSAIRFSWNKRRLRVSQDLFVETVQGNLLMGDEHSYLVGAVLQKGLSQAPAPRQDTVTPGIIDILNPQIIKLNADGAHLPDKEDVDAAHVATLFPQFGLIVHVPRADGVSDWNAAGEKAKKVTFCGGGSDGLLFAAEWELIIDRTKNGPAVRKKAYPHARTDYVYWAADPHPSDSACAYCVGLGNGGVGWDGRGSSGLAVACRRVSPRQ